MSKGFEIAFNIRRKILRIRAWGDWDADLEKKCNMALRDKILELSAHAQWKIWYVLVDVTRMLTRTKEFQSMLEKHVKAAKVQGIKRIAYIGNGAKEQESSESARDGPARAFFDTQDEAMHWLMKVQ